MHTGERFLDVLARFWIVGALVAMTGCGASSTIDGAPDTRPALTDGSSGAPDAGGGAADALPGADQYGNHGPGASDTIVKTYGDVVPLGWEPDGADRESPEALQPDVPATDSDEPNDDTGAVDAGSADATTDAGSAEATIDAGTAEATVDAVPECASDGDCDDHDACSIDTCQGGACVHLALDCDDHDACNGVEACSPEQGCLPGEPPDCVDDRACSVDLCDPEAGCQHDLGACACQSDADCDDHDDCNGVEACDWAQGTCLNGTPVTCDDGNPCTTDACVPATGACTFSNNSLACDDGDSCTMGDHCAGGSCQAGGPKSCDDGNPCTTDACAPATGACAYTNSAQACDDGNACTTGDHCAGGSCQAGSPKSCDDGNPCTTDSCGASGCSYVANAKSCDDGNACTTGDTCSGSSCKGGATKNCDDGNACTTDSCSPSSGCAYAPKTCNDGNACTTDSCNPSTGACSFNPISCDDGNACTTDTCSASSGCQHPAAPNGTSCGTYMSCQGGNCACDKPQAPGWQSGNASLKAALNTAQCPGGVWVTWVLPGGSFDRVVLVRGPSITPCVPPCASVKWELSKTATSYCDTSSNVGAYSVYVAYNNASCSCYSLCGGIAVAQ